MAVSSSSSPLPAGCPVSAMQPETAAQNRDCSSEVLGPSGAPKVEPLAGSEGWTSPRSEPCLLVALLEPELVELLLVMRTHRRMVHDCLRTPATTQRSMRIRRVRLAAAIVGGCGGQCSHGNQQNDDHSARHRPQEKVAHREQARTA